jgi:hypothetical protein
MRVTYIARPRFMLRTDTSFFNIFTNQSQVGRYWARGTMAALLGMTVVGCGVIKERPESEPSTLSVVGKPMSNEQAKEALSEIGGNFAYGPGLGNAAVQVGTVVVFPPYALYLLGNAVLSLSGYEPVTVASILPEKQGKAWSRTYDSAVSGPGKVVAAMAGHEYRSREVGDEKMRALLERINETARKSEQVKTEQ